MKSKIFLLALFVSFFAGGFYAYAEDEILLPDPILEEETVLSDPPKTVTVFIRAEDNLLYSGTAELPDGDTIMVPDSVGTPHAISAQSVLALLFTLDQSQDAFEVTDLEYYPSFSSLYLKCLAPSGGSPWCGNWQYAVGFTTPSTSIDTTILSGGETIGFYFGSPHRLVLSQTSVMVGESLEVIAQKYNYVDNTYLPLPAVTVAATAANPDDPWIPTVVATQLVDDLGTAKFSFEVSGTYDLGIAEDYYFPLYPIQVTPLSVSSGGGGGGGGMPLPLFSVPNALSFLKNLQKEDGSFAGDMYTDWAAIALASTGENGPEIARILSYWKENNTPSASITDIERHTMALLSLGQNPYDFHGVNYIQSIIQAFDGTQIGDSSLVTDDVFALIPLAAAGYTADDPMIAKVLAFILKNQDANGSWAGSVDFTAAVVQALKMFPLSESDSALSSASLFLQSSQAGDGGFGSVFSTSWAMQAMQTLGVQWGKNGYTPASYLGSAQTANGSALPGDDAANAIWATSYAIPAAVGKPWALILKSVQRPVVSANSDPVTVEVPTASFGEEKTPESFREEVKIPPDALLLTVAAEVLSEPLASNQAVILAVAPATSQQDQSQESASTEEPTPSPKMLTAAAGNTTAKIPWVPIIGSGTIVLLFFFACPKFFPKGR